MEWLSNLWKKPPTPPSVDAPRVEKDRSEKMLIECHKQQGLDERELMMLMGTPRCSTPDLMALRHYLWMDASFQAYSCILTNNQQGRAYANETKKELSSFAEKHRIEIISGSIGQSEISQRNGDPKIKILLGESYKDLAEDLPHLYSFQTSDKDTLSDIILPAGEANEQLEKIKQIIRIRNLIEPSLSTNLSQSIEAFLEGNAAETREALTYVLALITCINESFMSWLRLQETSYPPEDIEIKILAMKYNVARLLSLPRVQQIEPTLMDTMIQLLGFENNSENLEAYQNKIEEMAGRSNTVINGRFFALLATILFEKDENLMGQHGGIFYSLPNLDEPLRPAIAVI